MTNKVYVGNAFSLQMVARENMSRVTLHPIGGTPDTKNMISIVGHADIAKVLGVEMNRASVTLERGDCVYVAQLVGGRLPEGTTTLPDGFRLEWVCVEVSE
jgi:hypothetical protein